MSDTLKSYRVRIKSNITKNWAIYTLFLIVVLASFLRLYNLDNLNVIEDTEANKIIGMLHVWDTSLGNIFAHFFQSIPFGVAITELLLSLSAHFHGFCIFSVRLPIAIIGVLIVITVYFLGKELYNEKVGLLSAFLLAISPLHLWYTRMIIHHNVTALFIVLALYFFIKNEHTTKAYQSKRDWITKNKYLLLTVLMIWLGCCNEEPILGVLPVFLLYLLFTQKLSWIRRKELWIGFFVLLLPAFIFGCSVIGFIQGHVANRADFEYFWNIVHHSDFTAWKDYIIYWSLARFELVPFYRFHLPLLSALVFFSLLWLIIRHKKSELYLLFSIAIYGIFFTLYPEKHEYYMVHYTPMIAVALGGFIVYFTSSFNNLRKLHVLKPVIITLLVIGIMFNIPIVYSVMTSNPTSLSYGAPPVLLQGPSGQELFLLPKNPESLQMAYAFGHGMEGVADVIINKSGGKDIMIGNSMQPLSKSAYIYLYTANKNLNLSRQKYGEYSGGGVLRRIDNIVKSENEWISKKNHTIFWVIPTNYWANYYDAFEMNLLHKMHPKVELVKTIHHNGKPFYYVYKVLSVKEKGVKEEFYDISKTKPAIQYPVKVNYSNKILFLGYNLNYNEQDRGFWIAYYWKSLQKVNKDYMVFVHFTDENGKTIFQQDHPPAYGFYPTSKWRAEEIIKERYYIRVPPTVKQGNYTICIGLYYGGEQLPILNKEVLDKDNRAIIGEIEVK